MSVDPQSSSNVDPAPQGAGFSEALDHLQAERLGEAESLFRNVLAADPGHARAVYYLGIIAARRGAYDNAEGLFGQTLALAPDDADAHYNLGNTLTALGRIEEAAASYRRAAALAPNAALAHLGLAQALGRQGRTEEAIAGYRRALALNPKLADAHNDLGVALAAQARFDEAEASFERALDLDPELTDAHNNLAIALAAVGRKDGEARLAEAAIACHRRLAENPRDVLAWRRLGRIANWRGRYRAAEIWLGQAVMLAPASAEAHYDLGQAIGEQGRLDSALPHYQRALALNPDFASARFALCMGQLPILYRDAAEIGLRRAAYDAQLRALSGYVDHHPGPGELVPATGWQPFYLACQGANDCDLQRRYGSLVYRIVSARCPPAPLPAPPAPGEPVRLGIVSAFFRSHSNWKVPIKGWLSRLDRRAFRLFAYHTGAIDDDSTKAAAGLCERFVRGPLPLDRWRQAILADRPHILIYPEIGMHPVSLQLGAQRLARVQCNSWGHPETSGVPTLDYFLSSALMEPADGEDHYTERLVRLPNLSIYYEPLDISVVQLGRAELGLRAAATVYWSGQAIHKYLPQFDQVFPRIAREAGDCQFVFACCGRGVVDDLFLRRLDQAFAGFGLRARDYCIALAPTDTARYGAAIGQCDIFLDCIGWSGCNSTLESLPHDLPIVTLPGPLMRGRHTAAILQMMGVTETIATTIEAYVATAVRLARDPSWRSAIGRRMAQNKHRVYRDDAAVSGLMEFLDRAARGLLWSHRDDAGLLDVQR